MPHWLLSIFAFVVAIGVLVAVHEYGHYCVARLMGVKVLRYSIGFGGSLWSWTSKKSGIEYRIAAVPLGGYVKMLDEREGPVPDDLKPVAFNNQSVGKRAAIVFAGPAVNFAFAVLAYWLVLILGVAGIKPVIGNVPASSLAAQAGLMRGDQVMRVAGDSTQTWQQMRMDLLERALDHASVHLQVKNANGDLRTAVLDMTSVSADPEKLFKQLGLFPYRPDGTPVIAKVLAGDPAARAGLQSGDRVLAVDGHTMANPSALVKWIQAHPGETARFKIDRHGSTMTQAVTLASVNHAGKATGRIGAQIGVDQAAWAAMRTTLRLGPLAAVPAAIGKTWTVSVLTLRLLGKMVIGQVSWHNISGPIQIANYAGQTASIGLSAFLSFLALISISLGVINLLPVPVLDGGHLLYYVCEFVRGRPLPEGVQALGQQIGLTAIILLMGLAFYNDILRLVG